MKATRTVKSLEQIKVMAHPLRMRLLEAFSHKPVTTKQVAGQLGEQPTKLYHHVSALKRAGLIELVKTSKKRGTTEQYYQTVADSFIVDRSLFELKPRAKTSVTRMQVMTTKIFENALSEMRQSLAEKLVDPKSKKGKITLSHTHIRATPAQMAILDKKINALVKKIESMKQKRGSEKYGLILAIYPTGSKVREEKRR